MPVALSNRKPKIKDKRLLGIFLFLALLAAGSCGSGSPDPIVIFCSPDSPRMRQALAGLEAALGKDKLEWVCVPELGSQGDEELRRVRERRLRLLVVLGTPALIRVAPVEKRIPVVFALVANPYFTTAAYEPEHPEIHQENITGIASPPPLDAALEQGAALFGAGPWGLLYDPNDGVALELKQRFQKEAPAQGIRPLTAAATDAAGDRRGLERLLARGARVIYLPPAPSAARYAPLLLEWGKKQRVLVVSGHPEFHQGAILWLALDYRHLGEEAGALARRVLNGEAPAKIPIAEKAPIKVQVDERLLRRWSGYPSPQFKEFSRQDAKAQRF
ncbi:MAG: ABC transporter substrate-binding protein [Desulfobaccales bacterium]